MASPDLLEPEVRARFEAIVERAEDHGCVKLSQLSEISEELELDEEAAQALPGGAERRGARRPGGRGTPPSCPRSPGSSSSTRTPPRRSTRRSSPRGSR